MNERTHAALARVSETLTTGYIHPRLQTAQHESGHCIIGLLLGETCEAIGLGGKGSLGGGACWTRPTRRDVAGLRDRLVTLWAGVIAEGRELPKGGEPGDDSGKLRDVARELCGKLASDKRLNAEIERAKRRAEKLVRKHRASIDGLAARLLAVYDEIDALQK